MKFAPARTPERVRARKRPRSSTVHGIFDFSKFRLHDADPLLHSIFGCANSFFDLTTPFESQKPRKHEKKYAKRIYRVGAFLRYVGPANENDVRHENGQTLRGRYNSRDYRSTRHVIIRSGTPQGNEIRASEDPWTI